MLRCLLTFATLVLLWALTGQANHALAPLQVYLFLGGLFVTFAALRLSSRAGLATALLAGLLNDAATPLPFGTQMLLFAAACLVIQSVRDRLPHDVVFIQVVVALLANLALFVAFSLLRGHSVAGVAWARLGVDLLCSQAVLLAIAPWFFALQTHTLQLLRPGFSAFD